MPACGVAGSSGIQTRPDNAVVGAERPALEVGEHPVNPGQKHMHGHFADHLGAVVVLLQASV